MGIKTRIASNRTNNGMDALAEKLYREERNYRADRLVEKWSNVAEIGKGITDMPANTARNLAILLENQTRVMSRMNEAQLSTSFAGYTPENMLRLVRLSYPNSIRGMLFTEFAMETAHDSIKYIYPNYTNAQRDAFEPGGMDDSFNGKNNMHNRFDGTDYDDVMYESTESRYATELINTPKSIFQATDNSALQVTFEGGAFGEKGRFFLGDGVLYVTVNGKRRALAMQGPSNAADGTYSETAWFSAAGVPVADDKVMSVVYDDNLSTRTKACFDVYIAEAGGKPEKVEALADLGYTFTATGRYNSEMDLQGEYLGEVELTMRDYHFRPRPITLGVTWTQLTELVLDTSFGLSAEEMLMDAAAQEIKKTLDFQAVKFADAMQRARASQHFVEFDAAAGDSVVPGQGIKDNYWQTAQLVTQAIDRIGDIQLNEINRGGVSALVGGPAAVNYLKLHKNWSDRGHQPAIGGHKVGELDSLPVFKVPSSIIADDEIVTMWKNDQNDSDVSIAIGTLLPFYSTGAIQRKNLYKEAAVARFEDTKCLQPNYLGRVKIKNIREITPMAVSK